MYVFFAEELTWNELQSFNPNDEETRMMIEPVRWIRSITFTAIPATAQLSFTTNFAERMARDPIFVQTNFAQEMARGQIFFRMNVAKRMPDVVQTTVISIPDPDSDAAQFATVPILVYCQKISN